MSREEILNLNPYSDNRFFIIQCIKLGNAKYRILLLEFNKVFSFCMQVKNKIFINLDCRES